MARLRTFVYMDGREIDASSAVAFFEELRRSERRAPQDLPAYLELLRSRAALFYGIQFDVGPPHLDVATRCQLALSELMAHGWVRVRPRRQAPHGPDLRLS